MPIEAVSPEALEREQTRLKKELMVAPVLRQANTPNVLRLNEISTFYFRGRKYAAQPVSFRLGAELQGIRLRIAEVAPLTEESEGVLPEYVALCKQACELMWKECIPDDPRERARKRIRKSYNPLLHATDGEVGMLIDFFSKLRMLSSVRFTSMKNPSQE